MQIADLSGSLQVCLSHQVFESSSWGGLLKINPNKSTFSSWITNVVDQSSAFMSVGGVFAASTLQCIITTAAMFAACQVFNS